MHKDVKVAIHRPTWGHCKDCGSWSYMLNSKEQCLRCDKRGSDIDKIEDGKLSHSNTG